MINKTWTISVLTPFGPEEYSMVIKQVIPCVDGVIASSKGEMFFENGKIIDDEIFIESYMDYPISCNVKLQGKISDNVIDGYVYIDDYLKVPMKGSF